MQTWHTIKGYATAGIALIACPCHLPLTLPLILALTAGTAFGGWLSANTTIVYIASGVLFVGGLLLAGKWLMGDEAADIPKKKGGSAEVILVSSRTCSSCQDATDLWTELSDEYQFRFQKVDITSGKGRSLAAKHNIISTPTTLINGQVAFRGVPNRQRAIAAVT